MACLWWFVDFFFSFCLCYSPTRALASSILRLQASLSSVDLLQILYFNIILASLSAASYRLPQGLPTGLLLLVYPFSAFLGTLSSFILIAWPTHWSHLYVIFLVSSSSLYKLQISWFYPFHQWCLVFLQVINSAPKGKSAHNMLLREVVNIIILH